MPAPIARLRTAAGLVASACLLGLFVLATPSRAGCPCGSPADELVAARAGLVRQWIVQIPFDSAAARLRQVVVGEGLVVAQTGDGGIHAVQAAPGGPLPPGSLLWSRRSAARGDSALAAGIGGTLVTIAPGFAVEALERNSGRELWRQELGTMPDLGAVPSGDWVYVPLGSKNVLRLAADPLAPTSAPPPEPAGPPRGRRPKGAEPEIRERKEPVAIDAGGSLSMAPVPFRDGVCWCTDDGLIVALERTRTGWDRHEFDLGAPPAGPLRVIDGGIVVATGPEPGDAPADLLRIELAKKGATRLQASWRTPLPARPAAAPLAARGTIVVSLGADGLAAFSAATGESLWRCPLVGTIVAVDGTRVWCFDETGRLSGLDLVSGERRTVLGLGCFTVPVVNAASTELVLASPSGVVAALATAAGPAASAAADAPSRLVEPAAPADPDAVSDPGAAAAEPAPADPVATPP